MGKKKQEKEQCWSTDQETFNHTNLDDFLKTYDELKPGNVVYVGDVERATMKQLCDADDVLDTIADRACDIAGEHAEDCADVSAEAKSELNAFLDGWISKHCNLNFWAVKNVKEYVLTKKDFG